MEGGTAAGRGGRPGTDLGQHRLDQPVLERVHVEEDAKHGLLRGMASHRRQQALEIGPRELVDFCPVRHVSREESGLPAHGLLAPSHTLSAPPSWSTRAATMDAISGTDRWQA